MGNHSSGFSKTFVTNQSRNHKESKRPHSVLGISAEDNNRCNFKSAQLRSNNNNSSNDNKINNKYQRPPGMQLPPLPRSHSFHQVLRPTENGQILAAKGTIRGLEFTKPLTNNTKSPIADELKAILNSRRCKSETNLTEDNNSSNDSNQSESSNYEDSNKRKEFNAIRKSSASNGVAAKIQRAKYRAPPPPQNLTGSTQDLTNLTPHTNFDSNSNLTDSHKKSAKQQFIGSSSSSSGCSGNSGNIGNSVHNNLDINNKNGLTRKLSQKAYNSNNNNNNQINKISTDESSKFLIIPRLKLSAQHPFGHRDPVNGNGSQTNITGANHVMPSRYQSRNLIFDSKNAKFEGNNPVLKADCSQDYRKLRRSSSSNYETDIKSKTKTDLIPIDKQYKTKSIEKLSRELSNRDNNHNNGGRDYVKISDNPFYRELNSINSHDLFPELHNNNNNNNVNNKCNYKYFDELDFQKSNEFYSDRRTRNINKSGDSPALPPAFDDNFILRRNTPTAGLNEQKSSYYFNKQNIQNDKPNKNKTNPICNTKRAILPWSDTDSYNTNGTRVHHLTNDDIIRPSKPFNIRQHTTSSPPPPPPPPLLNFEYEFDISSANCKSIRTNVSDSANYSDEDEEEEIKVIIRPQLPPLKREQLSELRRERILLSEDLFNLKPFANHKSSHCWTPLHDLSTSDDDDGINSGNHSDESIQKSEKELNSNNCYDTRFTLKNQLRTLVHNKQIKQQNHNNLFPY